MSQKIDLSIVIPAYNEEKYIGSCLKSLVNQNTNKNYEIIVVDNNSTDATVKIASDFKDRLNLTVVTEKIQSRGAARAKGFKEAKGELILSTDADAILYSDWINTLTRDLGGKIVATTTSCKTIDLPPFKNFLFNIIQPTASYLYRLFLNHFWLAGFSFAISKSTYKKSGGFNSNLQALEDTDLAIRVSKIGKIKFINKPVIFSGRRFKKSLLAGLYQYLQSFIQSFLLKTKEPNLNNIR